MIRRPLPDSSRRGGIDPSVFRLAVFHPLENNDEKQCPRYDHSSGTRRFPGFRAGCYGLRRRFGEEGNAFWMGFYSSRSR